MSEDQYTDVPRTRIRMAGGDGRLSGLDHDSDVMVDKVFTPAAL